MPPYCEEHDMFHNFYGEHDDMNAAAAAARKDAERRDRAEVIAAETLRLHWGEYQAGHIMARDDQDVKVNGGELVALLAAAALQALTEKENAQ